MTACKILLSNLGYMRGFHGGLAQQMLYAHRHFYCSVAAQQQSAQQLMMLLERENPDICCFVEIDKGSSSTSNFNQLEAILTEKYPFFDIENKYGLHSRLRQFSFSKGKSNAFMAKHKLAYRKIYFTHGTKRLIYDIMLDPHTTLFFTHFSLKKKVRVQQLLQMRQLLHEAKGNVILLGDFNILSGFQELEPLLHNNNLRLLNDEHQPTFRFHRLHRVLDLCICSASIAPCLAIKIIPQPYSDHAALLVEYRP